MLLREMKGILDKNGFHLDDKEDEHKKFFDSCKDCYDAAFENKYGDELDKIEETVDKRFDEYVNNRIEETEQKIADINTRINMINGYIDYKYKKEQSYMFVDNDKSKAKKSKDKEKKSEEMTLLEKLNQRSDAGLLADKFTNFLLVNSLQK